MRRLCPLMFLFILVASSLCCLAPAQCATPVGGLISSNVTWSRTGSPYILTGPVGVTAGASLTIEAGVTVDFASYYIQVNGTLNARGSGSDIITFTCNGKWWSQVSYIEFMPTSTAYSEQTGLGCIVENARFNITTVRIRDCSPKISGNTFDNAAAVSVEAQGGAPIISDNTINCQLCGGITASGSAKVTNNFVNSSGYIYGIKAEGNVALTNNRVVRCWVGVTASGTCSIKDNVILGCYDTGLTLSGSSVAVEGNYISGNPKNGVVGGGKIRDNTIASNGVGIKNPTAASTIKNNNIVNNSQSSIYLDTADNIDATNNWWGTTDQAAVAASIHDNKNDYNAGIVTYLPMLNSPSSTAPSSPIDQSTPTIAPQPTDAPLPTPTADTQNTQPPDSTPPSVGDQSSGNTETSRGNLVFVLVVAVLVFSIVAVVVFVRQKH
ncbi:MAG: right-handed parallel beta-helix repeat-containing protein [Candidatus Bathyarchaeota archaeon]|nr:right-handed parallel beta-helix repeat-containing protein [Candidatus Bathyarchaeota archaeon]